MYFLSAGSEQLLHFRQTTTKQTVWEKSCAMLRQNHTVFSFLYLTKPKISLKFLGCINVARLCCSISRRELGDSPWESLAAGVETV